MVAINAQLIFQMVPCQHTLTSNPRPKLSVKTAGPEAVPAHTYDYDMLKSFMLQRKKDVDSSLRDDKVDDVGGGDDVGGKDDVAEGDGPEASGNSE